VPCFEIVAPDRHREPAAPLRFNRCTGETWILVRFSAAVKDGRRRASARYRWVALEISEGDWEKEPKAASGVSPHAASKPSKAAEGRCFEFSGRRYCE
jgi:hypothetical protein